MGRDLDRHAKKEIMKDIILQLHQGLSVDEAKERFEKEVGDISSTEIAEIEQALMNEGLTPEEIKKFCNVHALIFQSALEGAVSDETFPSHPVYLFKLENREIEKLISSLRDIMEKREEYEFPLFREALKVLLHQLSGIETHYERKEQLLFPFLERQGFVGPSKVMWGKDDEIRDLLTTAFTDIENIGDQEEFEAFAKKALDPLIEEILGMIFKEENILFPTALDKLSADDWVKILRESDEVGYVFVEKPKETEALMKDLRTALLEEPVFQDNAVSFPTGTVQLRELMHMLNTLPLDITFVDKEDKVAYFSDSEDRIFRRTRSVVGRKVQNCHPPQSVHVVERILTSFKEGKRDFCDFWLDLRGRRIYIRYLAVKDRDGQYLGTLEVSQDITEIGKLEGEKRLLDERG